METPLSPGVQRIQERLAEIDRIIQTQPSYITVYGSDRTGEIRLAGYRDELQSVFQLGKSARRCFHEPHHRSCLRGRSLRPRSLGPAGPYCYGLGRFDTMLYRIIRLLLGAMIRMSSKGEPMAELSAGLGLSNVGTAIREVQGFTSTAMYCTGFEGLYSAQRSPDLLEAAPSGPAVEILSAVHWTQQIRECRRLGERPRS